MTRHVPGNIAQDTIYYNLIWHLENTLQLVFIERKNMKMMMT